MQGKIYRHVFVVGVLHDDAFNRTKTDKLRYTGELVENAISTDYERLGYDREKDYVIACPCFYSSVCGIEKVK